ncbi:MAG: hypothetical protein JWN41_1202 [Thermoleophilia bacterium]|nr:hypothetical protein [Thermoleophilia bacterium]
MRELSRFRTAVGAVVVLATVVVSCVIAPIASAADALLETRTLFATERFTPSAAPTRLAGALPENLLAVRGETEAFQVVVNNTSGHDLSLDGRVTGLAAGGVTTELLRIGMVNVPTGSTGFGTPGGAYADPLPPLRAGAAGGALTIPAGQWGGVLVTFRVRTDAPAGDYPGAVELFSGNGGNEIVVSRQPFTLGVRAASGGSLLQSGAPGAFVTTVGVEAQQYWLGHTAMRNGVDKRFPGNASPADRMAQLAGLYAFLDEHNITPLDLGFGGPDKTGAMTCSYSNGGRVASFTFTAQLKERYFGVARAIEPGATQFPQRWFPYRTSGCDADSAEDDFTAVLDKHHSPSLKQDDALDPKAAAFWSTLARQWSAEGLYGTKTYVKNPFDEPSDATAAQRVQMNVDLPAANIALHKAVGKRAKVVLAGWPRDERKIKVCKPAKKGQKKACHTYEQDLYGNRKLWDGKGLDDVDVWMVPFSRMFGRISQPWLKAFGNKNRDREYINRLTAIRAKHKGGETWAYNFYTADRNTMQTTIDAPGTDPRLMYVLAAREGVTGLYISNLLMGWGSEDSPTMLDATHAKNGNPYAQVPYFKHPVYGLAAGWGTYIYPGYNPSLGLGTEADRNSAAGRPVSSLRMEALRDGEEDANLEIMYRNRFGQARLQSKLAALFPNKRYRTQNRTLGQVVFPSYDNTNMAQRMEQVRREMITELAA